MQMAAETVGEEDSGGPSQVDGYEDGNPTPPPVIERVPSRPAEFGPLQLRTQKDAAHLAGEVETLTTLRPVISF